MPLREKPMLLYRKKKETSIASRRFNLNYLGVTNRRPTKPHIFLYFGGMC